MCKKLIFIAQLFVWSNCLGQQYPFVYYTPKDGLANSRVRSIKQDSQGRMLFITYGGLSIYDGTRFITYNQQDGLNNEVVNDVAEAGPDSFFVATNTNLLNTLVNGRIGVFKTIDGFYPIINRFLKIKDNEWYVIADEGLFHFKDRKFISIPLLTGDRSERIKNLDRILEWKNYLLLMPWDNQKLKLIVYDKSAKKVVTTSADQRIQYILKDKSERVWISLPEGIRLLDTVSLRNNKLNFLSPSTDYAELTGISYTGVFFDASNNLWISSNNRLKIFTPGSNEKQVDIGLDLSGFLLNYIMQDREGTIWMASDGKGIIKMRGLDVQLVNDLLPGGPIPLTDLTTYQDTIWLFNPMKNMVVRYHEGVKEYFPMPEEKRVAATLCVSGRSLYILKGRNLVRIMDKDLAGSYRHPQLIISDTVGNMGPYLLDNNGMLIINKKVDTTYRLLLIKENKLLNEYVLPSNADQMILDKKGRLWILGRNNSLSIYQLHPENPSNYFQLLKEYSNELPFRDPRSFDIDNENNLWVGTRFSGVYQLKFNDLSLRTSRHFSTQDGLTDNFIYALNCDVHNITWVGTQSGLDKIFLKDGNYVVSNISKANNFFQSIWKIITLKNNSIWALTHEGTILRVSNSVTTVSAPIPSLLLTSLRINGQLTIGHIGRFSYKQNNLSFTVAAPSYIDERSIRYSYKLKGSTNDNWSEATNNAEFNFMNLSAGNYSLLVRADFPGRVYPTQYLNYAFTIHPPWWRTWWFRIGIGIFILLLVVAGIRFYYRRKIEKQNNILEKQKAVEQERVRIAADMHDDLGAGLTKIRYITEHILEKNESGETIQPELKKLQSFSSELVESMGEIIWATSEKNNRLSNTLYYLRSYAVNYCEENNLNCRFEIPDHFADGMISGNARRNIFLLLKECLHNCVKHANAKSIAIQTNIADNLELIISDDGKGFSNNGQSNGNGLINMRKRIQELKGSIHFENNNGATVVIQLPLNTNQRTIV